MYQRRSHFCRISDGDFAACLDAKRPYVDYGGIGVYTGEAEGAA